ncbi:hypothetical protein KQ873_02860 [Mycoplasma zalophidermidis]|uniref:hypothetical protein n=1 Tax=Mycoplasma zalophidermidis TaxID=398174 RepID=UPI001C10F9CE|nr:hypothetical protein [Mycoplasma zalophidermidis]MBU4689964.1 hypothetical protein [Mycoplasma zalophidermidis]
MFDWKLIWIPRNNFWQCTIVLSYELLAGHDIIVKCVNVNPSDSITLVCAGPVYIPELS